MNRIHFYKYQGTGNDFIIIDNRKSIPGIDDKDFIKGICHRRFGVGADGLMLFEKSNNSAFYMRYFNSDGGESTMCGNGGRCIASFAKKAGVIPGDVVVEFNAVDGIHYANVGNDYVSLKMIDVDGVEVINGWFFLNTGSPHVVILAEDVKNIDVLNEGRKIRNDLRFKVFGGTNVNFLTIKKKGNIAVRTFERGVEDETWSCGTGSVASAIVANLISQSCSSYDIEVPGGMLKVQFDNIKKGLYQNVWLEGPTKFVFEGYYIK